MATVGKSKVNDEVQITHEDQKMINTFANKNSKHNELKNVIANKKKEMQNLEDASDELMLMDEDTATAIPIHIGEVFVNLSMEDAQSHIDQCKEGLEKDIEIYEEQINSFQTELKELKIKLYAKFGNNINLEEEEEN